MPSSAHTTRAWWALIAIAALIITGLGATLVPVTAALALAYLLFPLVQRIEKHKISRSVAILATFGVFLAAGSLVLFFIIPPMFDDFRAFIAELPSHADRALERLQTLSTQWHLNLRLDRGAILRSLQAQLPSLSVGYLDSISSLLKNAFQNTFQIILVVMNLCLFPLIFFYVVKDFEKIKASLYEFVPRRNRDLLKRYTATADRIFSGYFHGQFIVVSILALLYATGLSLVGLPFGILIGLCTGFLSLIPYVGALLGFTTSIILILSDFDVQLLLRVVGVFIFVQAFEGLFLTPRIVGNKVGLNPLTTLLALIIAGNLGGFVGMLVAIPAAGILNVILKDLKEVVAGQSS